MLTALDAPPDALDEGEQSFVAKIKEHGWFRTGVFGDNEGPGFSFTTGFWVNSDQPELIIFRMKDRTAHDVFCDLYRDAKGGKALSVGKRTDALFANLPAYAAGVILHDRLVDAGREDVAVLERVAAVIVGDGVETVVREARR